jgi:hypothetical protein
VLHALADAALPFEDDYYGYLGGDRDEISHHFHPYTAESQREALERAGLAIKQPQLLQDLSYPPDRCGSPRPTAATRAAWDRTDFPVGGGQTNRLLTHFFVRRAAW